MSQSGLYIDLAVCHLIDFSCQCWLNLKQNKSAFIIPLDVSERNFAESPSLASGLSFSVL